MTEQHNLIQAILDSDMAANLKSALIAELLRLDYMRNPEETEQIIREYVQSNPVPKTRQ